LSLFVIVFSPSSLLVRQLHRAFLSLRYSEVIMPLAGAGKLDAGAVSFVLHGQL